MKRAPLHVAVRAHRRSVIALTVADHVQVERVVASPDGPLAERHGALLAPGTHRVALAPGDYSFRTLSDAHLAVVQGAVDTASHASNDKNPFPEPPPRQDGQLPNTKGDAPRGPAPRLTVA